MTTTYRTDADAQQLDRQPRRMFKRLGAVARRVQSLADMRAQCVSTRGDRAAAPSTLSLVGEHVDSAYRRLKLAKEETGG